MIRRIFVLAILLGAVGLFSGCASEKPQDPNHVSNIPWNRPEQWEGQGPMGGMTPQGNNGGGGF